MQKIKRGEKSIVVLGAGGTGSWLIPMLSKLDTKSVLVIDGDVVEDKNIKRQNFSGEDVNLSKSVVMSKRYGMNFSDSYLDDEEALAEYLLEEGGIPLVIGCLDNNSTRQLVHNVFHDKRFKDFIWVDAGNAERNGQVYVALKQDGEICYKSPLDLDKAFREFSGGERRPSEISCAEHSESAPQNISANVTSAVMLFNIVNNILSGFALLANKYTFDTRLIAFDKETVTEETDWRDSLSK